jgi:homopolymeric O-antigen transport system permease protein
MRASGGSSPSATVPGGTAAIGESLTGRVRALWAYRGFVLGMVARDFRARYTGSVLGASWAVLSPLVQIFIYTIVFSQVMQARLPGASDPLGYGLYICAGILPWGYMVEVITRLQGVFLEQSNLLKKVSFPRVTLPVYVFLSATVNFAIVWGLFLSFLLVSGRWPGAVASAMLPLLLLQQVLAVALGVFLGVINVYFRDVGQIVGVLVQFWFWLTPIVYPLSAVPAWARELIALNPATPLVAAYQGIVVEHRGPVWSELWPLAAAGALLALGADLVFRRLSRSMVDEL